ncbi:MAG TPA: SIR2 family protein [Polyangia bacterium]|jgi:hypothetical protein|nr:SIR2 family protein [Polyangia bacterium]
MAASQFDIGALDRRVLLSGAGLSRNWGGYLASEMWGAILGHPRVQESQALRELLLGEQNFETALAEVQTNIAFEAGREAMNTAVKEAFRLQDDNQRSTLGRSISSTWNTFAETVVRSFDPYDRQPPRRASFFFTLNQDVLLERGFRPPSQILPNIPGLDADRVWQKPIKPPPFTQESYSDQSSLAVTVTEEPCELVIRDRFNYVKLHGSFNWTRGTDAMMVLGGGKQEAIDRFWLLRSYFDLFKQILEAGDMRLLVVGYSFCDAHVNRVIVNAARHHRLKIVIVDPRPPADLRRHLLLSRCGEIWDALIDYVGRPLTEIYPADHHGDRSGDMQRIERSFLSYSY